MKKYIIIVLMALVSTSLFAQSQHEFLISAGGGLSGLGSETTALLDIKTKSDLGLNFGIGYAYNFSESFAFLTGLQMDLNKVGFELNYISGDYVVMDRESHWFKFVYDGENYREELKYTYLTLPLMIRYKHSLSEDLGVYVSFGPKVGINLKSDYKSSMESVNAKGAYVLWGQGDEIPTIDDLELEGFGSFPKVNSNGSVDMKPMIGIAAELGVNYDLNANYGLYIGAYFDYALNSVENSSIKHFVEYDHKSSFPLFLNSMSYSQYMKDDVNSLVTKMKPFNVGIKLSVSLGL